MLLHRLEEPGHLRGCGSSSGQMIDFASDALVKSASDVVGLAAIAADGMVKHKGGRLTDWLPAVGQNCFECTLLTGMEGELAALAEGRRGAIVLPGVRGVPLGLTEPITVVISWNEEQSDYLVVAMLDFAARQVETLLGGERRARRLIEEQLEAANAEARFAFLARERLRLARDLHDTLVHSMVALLTQIRLTRHFLSVDPARVANELATAEATAIDGLGRAREAIGRLRGRSEGEQPSRLEELANAFADRTGTHVSIEVEAADRNWLNRHATTIERIASEALANVEQHAKAQRVFIRAFHVAISETWFLIVEISDDGCGFDPSVEKSGHYGLTGMIEFAELAGGSCRIESARDAGTMIRISLPIERPAPPA
jgi:signal transduction histidine kinase